MLMKGGAFSFEFLHIERVLWDLQNFFHCPKNFSPWHRFPAGLQLVQTSCTQNIAAA